jgi:RNA polymerase sigma-70 factor (ECF subfamily)
VDDLTRLTVAAGTGDPDAIRSFVRRAQPDVWQLCSGLVGRQHADDLTQDTFIRILRALPAFRAESSARTWMLRITRYTCADWIRAQQRRRRLTEQAAELARASTPAETGRVELDDLLDHLPAARRDAFLLTQVLGLSYAEAAEVCECEVGTIRSRVARARATLVDELTRPVDGTADTGTGGATADDHR